MRRLSSHTLPPVLPDGLGHRTTSEEGNLEGTHECGGTKTRQREHKETQVIKYLVFSFSLKLQTVVSDTVFDTVFVNTIYTVGL